MSFSNYPPHGTFVRMREDYKPDPEQGEGEGISKRAIFMVIGKDHTFAKREMTGWSNRRHMERRCVIVDVGERTEDGSLRWWEDRDSCRTPRWECLEEVKVVICP